MEAAEGRETGDEVKDMENFEFVQPPEVVARLEAFTEWAEETLGFSLRTKDSDDWAAVIRYHAMIEAALNHLLIAHFKMPELAEVFPKMDNSDMKRGKLAFVLRLGLLPKEHIDFIQMFSELRNFMVHNASNFRLKIAEYPSKIDRGAKWIKLLALLGGGHIESKRGRQAALKFAETCAHAAFRGACFSVLEHIFKSSGTYLPS